MFTRVYKRLVLISKASYATLAEKSQLGALRKRTGYTFMNCKKALELNGFDIAKAEEWLHAQAQTEGWAKAALVKDRATSQGLVGILCKNNIAAMVEVNCETDFVSRNQRFQQLLSSVACATYESQLNATALSQKLLAADLVQLKTQGSGTNLADLVAQTVNVIGENIILRRATCIGTADENDVHVFGYAHPPSDPIGNVVMGRFGAIVKYRRPQDASKSDMNISNLQRQLCQQIIGMNPATIESDEPAANQDEETALLRQEFVADPDMTVGEMLQENGIQVLEFFRFECGEAIENTQL